MFGMFEARPPFVTFEQVARPDKEASLREGRPMTKNVNVAKIMQPGSKDVFETDAERWLDDIRRRMLEQLPNAYPPEWVDGFRRKYEMWKDGVQGIVPDGETSLRHVPFVSAADAENYAAIHVHTVEAAAAMTEDALRAAGMGARAFRDKCRAYLEEAKNAGTSAEQIASLKTALENKDAIIATLEARLDALEADKPKRGRPKLQEAA